MAIKQYPLELSFFILILILMTTSCKYYKDQGYDLQRPDQIPKEADWVGGPDGGVWVSIDSVYEFGMYQLSIYHESGEPELTGLFSLTEACKEEISQPIKTESFSGFDGGKVYLDHIVAGGYCYLYIKNRQ